MAEFPTPTSERLPSGEDLVVERRTKKTKKKKTPAPVRLPLMEAAAAAAAAAASAASAAPTPAPAPVPSPAVPPLVSSKSSSSSSTSSQKPATSSLNKSSLLGSLLRNSGGAGEQPEEKPPAMSKAESNSGLKSLLLSTGNAVEGEEDEQQPETHPSVMHGSSEEGDSLDSQTVEESAVTSTSAPDVENETLVLPAVAPASASSTPSSSSVVSSSSPSGGWSFGNAMKAAFQNTSNKLVSLLGDNPGASSSSSSSSPAKPVPAPVEQLPPTKSEREAELRVHNASLRQDMLRMASTVHGAVNDNMSTVSKGLTLHLALLVQARAEVTEGAENVAKLREHLGSTHVFLDQFRAAK